MAYDSIAERQRAAYLAILGAGYGHLSNKDLEQLWLSTVRGGELITNGTFDTNVSGWTKLGTGSLTWNAGTAVGLTDGANNVLLQQTIVTVPGKVYEVNVSRVSADSMAIYTSVGNGAFFASVGTSRLIITATGASTDIKVAGPGAFSSGTVDNISVKELPAAIQNTSSDALARIQAYALLENVPITIAAARVGLL